MKKVILIFVALISLTSCLKDEITSNPWEVSRYFQDVCPYGENTTYYMSCNINSEEVELYFSKKTKVTLWTDEIVFEGQTYYMDRDTVYIDREDYRYTPAEFTEVLIEKNKIKRDTTVFRFTRNMFCTWATFDKIYKTYIK